MSDAPRLMVFTDLDGTFLDHETYDWSPAKPALNALKTIGAALVLASSKTAPEIAVLRAEVGMEQWPAIVENGAGLLPAGCQTAENSEQYQSLRDALDALPADLRAPFTGFGDMSAEDVVTATGLPLPAAELARTRAFSEPGLWSGSDDDKAAFLSRLADEGIHAQQGGRFLTLSFGANKADQLRALVGRYHPAFTIALGDAPNDFAMLEAADHAVIVHNPSSPPLPALKGESEGRVTRTVDSGPEGWNSAVMSLLEQHNLLKR